MQPLSLGTVVSFNSPKIVPFATLKAGLSQAGLDPEMARVLLPHNAFRRACKSLSKNRVIDVIKDDENEMTFQFTKKEFQADRVDFDYERDVVVNKKTGQVTTSSYEFERQAQDLLDKELSIRHGGDITRLVHKIFDASGGDLIKIRPQGGAYFVPASHSPLVDSIRVLLEWIGGTLVDYEIGGTSETTKASIAQNMKDHFEGLLKEFYESCQTVTEDASDAVKERRQATLVGLRTKLEAYKSLMQDFSKDIKEGIDNAEAELNRKLFGSIFDEADADGADGEHDEHLDEQGDSPSAGADESDVHTPVEAHAVHDDINIDNLFAGIF